MARDTGPGGEVPSEVPAGGGSIRDLLKWRRHRKAVVREHQRRGEVLPEVHPHAGKGLRGAGDSITWAGHASVIHRLDGHTVLMDPVWSNRLAFMIKRMTPPAPRFEDVPTPEIITLSHNHYDHMDAPTLKRVKKTATVCVPKGNLDWFRRRRFTDVHEFDWWETRDVRGLKVTFVPSRHFSGRTPWDRNKSLFGGWVVEGKRSNVYHGGDSGYFPGFKAIGERFPKLDVACLPVGAYEPRWFMRPYHVDPDEAGQAFLDVKATRLLPIHWGTFRLSDEAMDDPPKRISAFFQREKLDPARLLQPRIGETIPVDRDA